MQAEQCFAVAHKMDRKSIWPVCVGAWHTPVYPLVEHSGSEFPARSTVAFTCSSEIWWTHPQCAAAVALGMMNSGNGCLGASAGATIG